MSSSFVDSEDEDEGKRPAPLASPSATPLSYPPTPMSSAGPVRDAPQLNGALSPDLKNKMQSAVTKAEAAATLAPAVMEPAEDDGPKVCTFLVKEQARDCKAVFVPNGYRMATPKIDALVVQWGLEEKKPGTLISCDAGTVHPNAFASILLAKLPSFSQFWSDATQHAKRTSSNPEGQAVPSCRNRLLPDYMHCA